MGNYKFQQNRMEDFPMKLSTNGQSRDESTGLNTGQAGKFAAQRKGRRGLVKQRRVLLGLREAVMERIQDLAAEAREENPSYSLHMADAATDTIDRDVFLGLVSFEQEMLYEIDAALRRIEEGTYGICELTGRSIPAARLEAIPWTRFAVDAQKEIEGSRHPHIGALGRVRLEKEEQPEAACR
jgi:RNA polymerase-binding transcription factor DksA